MQSKNLPSQLPFLPGNIYADPTITRYHKTQLLNVRDGAIQGKLQNQLDILYECFRENHKLARKYQPGLAQIHERRQPIDPHWHSSKKTIGERCHSQDRPQVAQIRPTSEYLPYLIYIKSHYLIPTRSSNSTLTSKKLLLRTPTKTSESENALYITTWKMIPFTSLRSVLKTPASPKAYS